MDANLKIVNMDGRIVPLSLNIAQRMIHKTIEEVQLANGYPVRGIVLKARRQGISTYTEGRFFYEINHREHVNAVVASADVVSTNKVFKMAKMFQKSMPRGIQKETDYSNRKEIVYSEPHGSAFIAQTAGTEVLGRGGQNHYFHPTEFAFWKDAKAQFGGAMQEVPDKDSMVIIESTANGIGGAFHDMYWQAKDDWKFSKSPGNFLPFFLPWFVFPEYQRKIPYKVKFQVGQPHASNIPAEWLGIEEEMVSKYHLTEEQLFWRRWAIKNKCQNDLNLFQQEYPWCLSGDTMVSSADGIVRIADVLCDGKVIQNKYKKGIKLVFELSTYMGYTVKATTKHKIKTKRGFVELSKLCDEDEICLQAPLFSDTYYQKQWSNVPAVISNMSITDDWGRFLGYYMGDGSINGEQLSFAGNSDFDIGDDISGLVYKLFGKKTYVRETGKKDGNSFETRFGSTEVAKLLDLLGCTEYRGTIKRHRGRLVCVPECIFKSPKSVVRQFLSGLFEADGYNDYKTPRVIFFSKYEQFTKDVQLLLLGFGITSRRTKIIKNRNRKTHVGYQLALRCKEAIKFNQDIGFISKRKRNRCTGKESNLGVNAIPLVLTDKITSIVTKGEEEVYDITTEPTSEFSANGICVHNCDSVAFNSTGRNVFLHSRIDSLSCKEGRTALLIKQGDRIQAESVAQQRNCWQIWVKPQGGHSYAIGVDTMEGTQSDPDDPKSNYDFHAMSVLDRDTGEIVAVYLGRGGQSDIGQQAVLAAKWYNSAWIAPELPMGMVVLDVLRESGYDRIYQRQKADEQRIESDSLNLGWRTTLLTRPKMVDNFKTAFNEGDIKIYSSDLVDEMRTFVYDKQGTPRHRPGKHDDLLFASMIALQLHLRLPFHSSPYHASNTDGDQDFEPEEDEPLSMRGAVDIWEGQDEDDDEFELYTD